VIDKGLNYGHALVSVDLDGDGADELVAGYMGKPNGVNVYRRNAEGAWSRFVLESNAMPGSGCVAADFNNDKRMDLACTGGTSLKWYENQPAK
jgi:asparagine synthetase B (glutamine-hydrolysing)